MLEQDGIGVERMQFAFDALLEDQVFVRLGRGGCGGDGIRRDIAELQAAIGEPREQSFEKRPLFGIELLAFDFVKWNHGGVHHRAVSIHVALVAFFVAEFLDVIGRLLKRAPAGGLNHLVQRGLDIRSHALGVAANVNVRTGLEPRPEFPGGFEHPVLHVNLFRLVARKGGVQPRQMAAGATALSTRNQSSGSIRSG